MERRNWMQLSKTLIQKYKICSLSTTLRSLPLQVFITAVSSFSGPIAIIADKSINHQFKLPDNVSNSIVIFNCKGELKKTIAYNTKDRVMFLGFTKIEELLVIEASGDYFLIDPFSGQMKQGNYTSVSYSTPEAKERYRGCQLLPNGALVMLRETQIGYAQNIRQKWQPIPELRIKIDKPIFSSVFGCADEFIILSRECNIELYNITEKKKVLLYTDSYLNKNWQNLLCASFNKTNQKLGLVFCNPSIILYIDTQTNEHKKLQVMIQLKYGLESSTTPGLTNRYISKNAYKQTYYTLSWITCEEDPDISQANAAIMVFANPKLLVLYDGDATRLSPRSNCNQMLSVESDCVRIYTEDSHEIMRTVPYLYQTIIEINRITQGYYITKFKKIIQLHDEYSNYVEKDIIDLEKLDAIWRNYLQSSSAEQKNKQNNQGNQNKQIQIQYRINKENTAQLRQNINKVEQEVINPLIKSVKFCIDPVDQVKMLKFICFIKNLYSSSIDIYDLCCEMRIVNNLKFQFLNRTLTINQFEFLKNQPNQRFLTILLRSNMHFIADTIFGDSQSKYKILLHWAKCKIQKNNEAIAFEEIRQKFDSMPKKLKNSKIFTDIGKYSLDRGRTNLAQNLIELDENADRRIMFYLLMLVSNPDKKIAQKLLNATQESRRSSLIFRVIREMVDAKWIQNSTWVNILHDKPNVARHYICYLKAHNEEQLLKNYYIQNKQYEQLGFLGLTRLTNQKSSNQMNFQKFSEGQLNNFLPKIQQFRKFLPGLAAVGKSYTKNSQLQILRKVQYSQFVPSDQEIKDLKNDTVLQYLGEILFTKKKDNQAILAFSKIKSDKVYNILLRKQKLKIAIDIAFERKNKQMLKKFIDISPQQIQQEIAKRMQIQGIK